MGVCPYDVFLRALGSAADTSSTLALASAAQANADAKRGSAP